MEQDREKQEVKRLGHGGCGCCGLSRRCFLGAMAAGATALATGCSGLGALLDNNPREAIDLAALRPRPRVRILSAVVRNPPPYWLGWPGASYPLAEELKRYDQLFAEAAARVGVRIENEPAPLENAEAVERFARKVKAEKPQAVLIHIQHLQAWGWAGKIADAGIPTLVFAPVGTAFTGQVNGISHRPGVQVISSLEAGAVGQALRAVRAKQQFEATRLLVVGGKGDKEGTMGPLGTKMRRVPRNLMEEAFARVPENEEAHAVMRKRFRHARKVVEPTRQDGLNAARSYIAAKTLLKAEDCNALTTDCLGMVNQKKVPTPPCMAASLFQDAGVTYGCEADVNGALSLMLPSYLLDKPGFMNDPVPETVHNWLIASHCVCGTMLNGFSQEQEPYILRSHSESNIGVSLQVLFEKGHKVTLARFKDPSHLIVDTGTVVGNINTPPAGGCRTSVALAMDRIEDSRDVQGFHQVVFYGDHRRDLEAFAQLCGITVIHSPEHSEPVQTKEKKA